MNYSMNEPKFLDDWRGNYKWIKIRQPHAAINGIQDARQWNPFLQHGIKFHSLVKRYTGNFSRALGSRLTWMNTDSKSRRSFQGVYDMQIMRPGFRPILPWMGTGVSGHSVLRPV